MIKALNKILKQDKEKMKIPKSVQQVIPVKRIWPDGIWQVGNKFSRCWRFSDINYSIASKDDKTSMFLDYSELLNALDSRVEPIRKKDEAGKEVSGLSSVNLFRVYFAEGGKSKTK